MELTCINATKKRTMTTLLFRLKYSYRYARFRLMLKGFPLIVLTVTVVHIGNTYIKYAAMQAIQKENKQQIETLEAARTTVHQQLEIVLKDEVARRILCAK